MSEGIVSLLVVSRQQTLAQRVRESMVGRPCSIECAQELSEALAVLERSATEIVFVDIVGSPQAWIQELLTRWPSLPIIVVAQDDRSSAIAAALGAIDVLVEPVPGEELAHSIQKALTAAKRCAATPPIAIAGQGIIFGRSLAMQAVRELLDRVAPTQSTVLIRGESGTGKELVARTLHRLSARAERPLIKIDCTSLPETLLESELFGYERGAFTGAAGTKPGRVELANRGTLFLDEVGELSLATQSKLLRLLQDREFERLGGTRTIHVDIRVVAATHRDLERMSQEGTFREDLFYRLNVLPVWLPPLRARRSDIEDLARHFFNELSTTTDRRDLRLSDAAVRALASQRWPGNVRQLQNFVERLVILSRGPSVTEADVNGELGRPVRFVTETGPAGADAADNPTDLLSSTTQSGSLPLHEALKGAERRALGRALKHANGNRSVAARMLGVSRSTLYNKLEEYGLL